MNLHYVMKEKIQFKLQNHHNIHKTVIYKQVLIY